LFTCSGWRVVWEKGAPQVSLGFARDDKSGGGGSTGQLLLIEAHRRSLHFATLRSLPGGICGWSLAPVVGGLGYAVVHDGFEGGVFLDEDLVEVAVLPKQYGLQAYQFQEGQEHADEGSLGTGVP
jgi:hypothetical protein